MKGHRDVAIQSRTRVGADGSILSFSLFFTVGWPQSTLINCKIYTSLVAIVIRRVEDKFHHHQFSPSLSLSYNLNNNFPSFFRSSADCSMFSIQTKRRNTRAKRAGERKGHQVLTIKEELDGRRRSWKMLQLTESLTGRECLRATAPFGSGVLEQQQQRNSLHKKIYNFRA